MLQLDHYCFRRFLNIPEYQLSLLVECSCSKDVWHARPRDLQALKPTHGWLWVCVSALYMRKRYLSNWLRNDQSLSQP